MGDTDDHHDAGGKSYDQSPLNIRVDSPMNQWLRETFLAIDVNEPVEYQEPYQHEASSKSLLLEQERHDNALPISPPAQKAVFVCTLPGQVRHLKWCLITYIADHVDIFHMYAEI